MTFEYKVVPAPTRGRRVKGVKTPADRFARALEEAINDLAGDGWEYLRTDTLPAEERQGLTGRTTVYQNMLVFRRAIDNGEAAAAIAPEPAVEPVAPPAPAAEPAVEANQGTSLDTMIAEELAAVRAPRLPSADAAQKDPGKPVKAPGAGGGKSDMAAE